MAIKSLVQYSQGFMSLSDAGEFYSNSSYDAISKFIGSDYALVCYKKNFKAPLSPNSLDVLELFAFVHPAKFCIPSISGLCSFLDISEPLNSYEEAEKLFVILEKLLEQAALDDSCYNIAKHLANSWMFAKMIIDKFKQPVNSSPTVMLWNYLEEIKPLPPSSLAGKNIQITSEEINSELQSIISKKKYSEIREAQYQYAEFTSKVFSPLRTTEKINLSLSEAGTGIGKTIGYLVPAYLWAEKNASSIWISTYTKALQNQIYKELDSIFPDPETKKSKVTVRKGRENYLCLLNYEEALKKISPNYVLLVGLIARYIYKTQDGDLNGPNFAGWIEDLVGYEALSSLCDKRGECIYNSCPHYKKCFIEKVINKTKTSKIVITNHALLMNLAQKDKEDNDCLPFYYIFDEGHHLFNASDNAFSSALSVLECYEIRRWVLGSEKKQANSRMKGLKRRIEDLIAIYPQLSKNIEDLCLGFSKVPQRGARSRIKKNEQQGLIETFFANSYNHIKANSYDRNSNYSQQAEINVSNDFLDTSEKVIVFFQKLKNIAQKITEDLDFIMSKNAKDLDTNQKNRIEGTIKSFKNRIINPITVWLMMLNSLKEGTPEGYVDFFEISKIENIDFDIALNRHFIDPTIPFALSMKNIAKGIMITSATLNDSKNSDNWEFANKRLGVSHFETNPQYFQATSPFDYQSQSQVIIVNDVNRNDIKQLSSAYRELLIAANGGGLGIFTAISRLKAVYKNCLAPLNSQGIKLISQHIDDINTSTLVDMFKYDYNSCLFGTDSIRDGIDIPGLSLRLIIFERIPWQRADILHKTRKSYEKDKNAYDCSLARAKLEQGFGRLIRSKNDTGTFVILEKATPTVLLSAFPKDVSIQRLSLKETIEIIKNQNK